MTTAYPEWRRLEELLAAVRSRGIERLAAGEILEFGRLYRRAAAELSFHRTHEVDSGRLAYLNALVGQCYPYVYTAPRRPWPSVWRFFAVDYPRAFRQHCRLILLSFLVFMIPAVIGGMVSWQDRAVADQVLPQDLLHMSEQVAERHSKPQDWLPLLERAPSATFILTHNIGLTILDFAGGMTAGIVTIISLIYNGLMLGVLTAIIAQHGWGTISSLWAFIAPHGVFELTAIFIAGGAGFVLAYAIVNPGELPRRIALREAGKEAVKLMLGVAAMLTVAGFIEAFFSPVVMPDIVKFVVAGCEAVLLCAYLAFAGRRVTAETPVNALMTPLPPV